MSPRSETGSRRRVADALLGGACVGATAVVVAAFAWIVGELVVGGIGRLDWRFLTTAPESFGREGGIAPVLVATLYILLVCLAVSVPLGTATAVYLAEFSSRGGRRGRLVRASLDVLAGVPSIVFGLFGNAFFCVALGLGYSILSGGLTLACMVLPILVRSIELSLRSLSGDLRLAGTALGLSKTRLIRSVLLPAAGPGVVAGLMLGIGRAMAETAALMFTSGYVPRTPTSLLDSGRALSLHIHDLAMNVSGGEANAHASALVLLLALVGINVLASLLVEKALSRGAGSGRATAGANA